MIKCQRCHTSNLDTSRFCDECGERLQTPPVADNVPAYVPPRPEEKFAHGIHSTSTGVPPPAIDQVEPLPAAFKPSNPASDAHALMVIERGDVTGAEFSLVADDSTIGRWDADNGIFPDVDLDAFDQDAKVSRRHARVFRSNGSYFIEDLGSTNGTYVNRGRRLLPGTAQPLNDGDEVIVGKTFLRFRLVN